MVPRHKVAAALLLLGWHHSQVLSLSPRPSLAVLHTTAAVLQPVRQAIRARWFLTCAGSVLGSFIKWRSECSGLDQLNVSVGAVCSITFTFDPETHIVGWIMMTPSDG
ncbi:hypothetical protein RRG08_042507 [Elysia crispata]|uniref:Uncharacterized protein n=1 Tax=Elysia crispata TaxID=231223 RepID=A0AAE0XR13_9GAST|nr:hypothetical protein RRG08_042507 [Elysia crispata]